MCGIVGVVGNIGPFEEKVFKTLLELDTIRGPHSTGVVVIDRKGESHYEKIIGTPWTFYRDSKLFFDKGTYKGLCNVLIGHNRWATTGEITIENAHPFDFPNIIGVHNGTLVSSELSNLDAHDEYEVDSQVLFHNINKNGIEKTIPRTCGAYSLVWWDKKEKSLHFLRNQQRPMWYIISKDKNTIYWASEDWMLRVVKDRHNIDVSDPERNKVDHLYTLKFNKEKKGKISFGYEIKPLEGKEPPPRSYPTSGVTRYLGYSNDWPNQGKYFRIPQIGKKTPLKVLPVHHAKNLPSTINVFYNLDDGEGDSNYFYMREHITNKKVKVFCSQGHYARQIALKSESWEYFTISPNAELCTFDAADTKDWPTGYIAQGNSIQGPFEIEKLKKTPLYTGYNERVYSKDKMEKILSNGCSWCQDNSHTIDNYYGVMWISEDEFVCGHCDGNFFIQYGVIN